MILSSAEALPMILSYADALPMIHPSTETFMLLAVFCPYFGLA